MPRTMLQQLARRKGIIFVWAAVFFLLFLAGHWYNCAIDRIRTVLSDCSVTNTVLPCTVTVIGSSSTTASVHIAFATPQGRAAGSYERSWQGSKLYLSAYMFRTQRGVLVFPYRVYTKAEKKYKGIRLLQYYTDSAYPVLYDTAALQDPQRKAVKELFMLIRAIPAVMHICGDLEEATGSIDAGAMQKEYVLFVSPKNTIRFVPSAASIY